MERRLRIDRSGPSPYEHRYPRRTSILLIFYSVTEFSGVPESLAFEKILWELPEKLPGYDFLDGDIDFVRRLAAREFYR